MNEFNRNENEMNENKMNEEEMNKAEEIPAEEPKNDPADIAGNDNTAPETAEPAETAGTSGNLGTAEGAYSYTRENIPNNTYNPNAYARPVNAQNAQPQTPPQQNPGGAYGYGGNPNPGTPYANYRYNPAQGQQPQQNPYNNGQFTNGYAPQNGSPYYGGMARGDGSIAYAPAEGRKKALR